MVNKAEAVRMLELSIIKKLKLSMIKKLEFSLVDKVEDARGLELSVGLGN